MIWQALLEVLNWPSWGPPGLGLTGRYKWWVRFWRRHLPRALWGCLHYAPRQYLFDSPLMIERRGTRLPFEWIIRWGRFHYDICTVGATRLDQEEEGQVLPSGEEALDLLMTDIDDAYEAMRVFGVSANLVAERLQIALQDLTSMASAIPWEEWLSTRAGRTGVLSRCRDEDFADYACPVCHPRI